MYSKKFHSLIDKRKFEENQIENTFIEGMIKIKIINISANDFNIY
jgi:hypothetical protein